MTKLSVLPGTRNTQQKSLFIAWLVLRARAENCALPDGPVKISGHRSRKRSNPAVFHANPFGVRSGEAKMHVMSNLGRATENFSLFSAHHIRHTGRVKSDQSRHNARIYAFRVELDHSLYQLVKTGRYRQVGRLFPPSPGAHHAAPTNPFVATVHPLQDFRHQGILKPTRSHRNRAATRRFLRFHVSL